MIASLQGTLLEKAENRAVINAGGVGYEIAINASTSLRLTTIGQEAMLYVFESAAMYGGGVTLYGFINHEDKQMFLTLKSLKATGAKKALEYLEKIAKAMPDFRRAILDGDAKVLKTLFGFTPKTAERLISGLKDKLGKVELSGSSRIRNGRPAAAGSLLSQTLDALSALGYTAAECRTALDDVQREPAAPPKDIAEFVRRALRRL